MTQMLGAPLWDGMPATCGCLCARPEDGPCSVCRGPVTAARTLTGACGCRGEIPDEWGESGSFPSLRNLSLSFNPLSGDLPETWGSDASSLQNLTHLNISNCNLNNTLPMDWARNLPSLVALNLSANAPLR